jgi:hypothetical protein
MFRIHRSEANPPAIVPTQFPPIEPIAPAASGDAWADMRDASLSYADPRAISGYSRPVVIPVYYQPTALPSAPTQLTTILPEPRPQFYAPIPALDEWPLSRIASTSMPPLRSTVVTPAQSLPAELKRNHTDRLQLTAWALLRPQRGGIAGPQSLANGGSLGGSQAGARLSYNFTRQISATLRSTSEVGRRGGEVAAGPANPALGRNSPRGHRGAPAADRPLWRRPQRLCLVLRGGRMGSTDADAPPARRISARRHRRIP